MLPTLSQAGRAEQISITVAARPIVPSPLRSWWKLVSSDSSAMLFPDTAPVMLAMKLPLLSVFQTVYWSAPGIFQATS